MPDTKAVTLDVRKSLANLLGFYTPKRSLARKLKTTPQTSARVFKIPLNLRLGV